MFKYVSCVPLSQMKFFHLFVILCEIVFPLVFIFQFNKLHTLACVMYLNFKNETSRTNLPTHFQYISFLIFCFKHVTINTIIVSHTQHTRSEVYFPDCKIYSQNNFFRNSIELLLEHIGFSISVVSFHRCRLHINYYLDTSSKHLEQGQTKKKCNEFYEI